MNKRDIFRLSAYSSGGAAMRDKPSVRVCDSCPWLKSNHGKPHPAGWYKTANLVRLWNGLRTARAPGMVCHSSDPQSAEYGSTKTVHPDVKPRECAGALILVIRHCNEAGKTAHLSCYQTLHKRPLTRAGLRHWVERYIFGGIPAVDDYRTDEVQEP